MSGSSPRQKKGLAQFHGRLKKRAEEEISGPNQSKIGIGGTGGKKKRNSLLNKSPEEKIAYYETELRIAHDDIKALKKLNDDLSNQIHHIQSENDSKHANTIVQLRNQLDLEKRKNFTIQAKLEKAEKDLQNMSITTMEGDFALEKAQRRIKELENDLNKWMDLEKKE